MKGRESGSGVEQKPLGSLVSAVEEQTRTIHRLNGTLGLSLAGGTDSPPFNPDRPQDDGIFISKVSPHLAPPFPFSQADGVG